MKIKKQIHFIIALSGAGEVCAAQQGDIIFIVDVSSGVGSTNWKIQTSFLANLTKYFTVGSSRVRFGAMTFNRTPNKIFDLKDNLYNDAVSKALLAIPYRGDVGSNTDLALDYVHNAALFSSGAGGRDTAPNIAILITSGMSTNIGKTFVAADTLKESDKVKIITVGIGQGVNIQEQYSVASQPEFAFFIPDYVFFDDIRHDLIALTCQLASNTVA